MGGRWTGGSSLHPMHAWMDSDRDHRVRDDDDTIHSIEAKVV